ncbi:uncharacterized protein CDAR_277501 [Caerostris darwini]|uniref:Uncharacterized protein n=1 Tax=Caerostris darwini TaxID=1538125 RepID=A0AAV4VSM2_9ARAC|nr:uncharacterized protein CDAR_277501 [Caerostris darwini]
MSDEFYDSKPKNNSSNAKYRSFGSYLRAVLKTSLITSFPQIATSKSWLKRIIKIAVFVMCLVGFAYQTLNFMWMYLAYPTVVNVYISNPYEIVKPAITVCNKNRGDCRSRCPVTVTALAPNYHSPAWREIPFYRMFVMGCYSSDGQLPLKNPLGKQFPSLIASLRSVSHEINLKRVRDLKRRTFLCSQPKYKCTFDDPAEFCDKYPAKCPGLDPQYTYSGLITLDQIIDKKYDWKSSLAEAHNDTVIKLCIDKLEEKSRMCKKPYRRVPVIDAKGEPNVCHTIDSLVGRPEEEDQIYPNTYVLELHLDTQGEEYVVFTDPVLLQMMIHDRRTLVNPFSQGSSLEAGVHYKAFVSMTAKELLPLPYDTKCLDYLKEWRENNGTGPLNHLMCVERCKLRKLLEMNKCIDRNVDYPHIEQLCPQVQSRRHLVQSVEMFSYIGGYMGMWLGLSLISLFDLYETICFLLYFPFGRFRMKSKKTRRHVPKQGRRHYSDSLGQYY